MGKAIITSFMLAGLCATMLSSCMGGVYDGVTPYPYPKQGNYAKPPIEIWPDFSVTYGESSNHVSMKNNSSVYKSNSPSLQIAYQSSVDPRVEDLVGLLTVDVGDGYSICSATPIAYDAQSDRTTLVTAAHCVTATKSDPNALKPQDLYPVQDLYISQGIQAFSDPVHVFDVVSVYVPNNYCNGSKFLVDENGAYYCPNLKYKAGTQGNDIAVVVISGKFGDPQKYAQIAALPEYPTVGTKPTVLSVGFGVVNGPGFEEVWPSHGIQAFAISNYLYGEINAQGYHYLLSSFFNEQQKGYAALVCSGDSGGGDFFWDQKDGQAGRWILIAEHTYGPSGVCGGFYKNLYTHGNGATNVGHYYDWVNAIVNSVASESDNHCDNAINNCVMRSQ